MGRWLVGLGVVVLLGITATGAWYYGLQFTRDLRLERNTAAALSVPLGDLAALSGQNQVKADYLPIHLKNATNWQLTAITLALETADDKPPLTIEVSQNFRPDPWGPGDVNAHDVFLAAEWNGRPVRYHVTAAKGFVERQSMK